MCTGLEVAGLVTALAGTGLSISGAQTASNNMNNALKTELLRQQGYAKQGQSVFQQSLQQSTPQATKAGLDQGTQQAQQVQAQARAVPLSLSSTVGVPSNYTNDSTQQARTGLSDQANAKNQSYNAFAVQQALRNLLTNQQLGVIGSQAQASGGVLPYELQAAQQSGAGQQGFGSILQSLGGLLGTFGATRPGNFLSNRAMGSLQIGGGL